MAYRDLRDYLECLRQAGELLPISREVDWHLEVGAIIRRVYDLKAPAPLFERLKGYPAGYRILGAPLGPSSRPNGYYARAALAFGLPPDTSATEIILEYIQRKKRPMEPVMVTTAPCKEEIHLGAEADLEEFPSPLLHEGDGGRYIGTWHTVITKDPDSGWVNWGTYRLMLHDRQTMGGLLLPSQHIGFHYYQKYEARRLPMEFAVALGTEPITPMISGATIPAGVNEVDIIGGIRQAPLELIACETVALQVPAGSEIILEGEILPHERQDEGPFGEFTGYLAGDRAPRPVYHVKAITHRRDPILPVACPGVPVYESHIVSTLIRSGELLDDLQGRGFPVKMVYSVPESASLMTVISTRVPYANYTRHLANAVWATKTGVNNARYLVIVEDDVEPTNLAEVVWAISTRCHPKRGIFKMTNTPGMPLLPYLSSYEKQHQLGDNVLFDCTWPKEWPKETLPIKASFDTLWPKEIQERVQAHWQDYGFKAE